MEKILEDLDHLQLFHFRAVDEIPRWVPLWFPSGGKSHAYNLLGGKRSKLSFDLPKENSDAILEISNEINLISSERTKLQSEISEIAKELAILAEGKTMLSGKFSKVDSDQKLIFEIENVIKNFTNTLNLNPSLSAVIGPQLEKERK